VTKNGAMPLPHLLTIPVEVSPQEISVALTAVDQVMLLVCKSLICVSDSCEGEAQSKTRANCS